MIASLRIPSRLLNIVNSGQLASMLTGLINWAPVGSAPLLQLRDRNVRHGSLVKLIPSLAIRDQGVHAAPIEDGLHPTADDNIAIVAFADAPQASVADELCLVLAAERPDAVLNHFMENAATDSSGTWLSMWNCGVARAEVLQQLVSDGVLLTRSDSFGDIEYTLCLHKCEWTSTTSLVNPEIREDWLEDPGCADLTRSGPMLPEDVAKYTKLPKLALINLLHRHKWTHTSQSMKPPWKKGGVGQTGKQTSQDNLLKSCDMLSLGHVARL